MSRRNGSIASFFSKNQSGTANRDEQFRVRTSLSNTTYDTCILLNSVWSSCLSGRGKQKHLDERKLIMLNEKTSQCCARHTKNMWTRCKGLTSKSEKLARITLKKRELKQRKKAFGIEYFDLEQRRDVTEEQLQACIKAAKNSVAALEQEMVALQISVQQVSEKTRKKIAKRNSKVPQRSSQSLQQRQQARVKGLVIESNPFDSSENDFVVVPPHTIEPSAPSEELLHGRQQ